MAQNWVSAYTVSSVLVLVMMTVEIVAFAVESSRTYPPQCNACDCEGDVNCGGNANETDPYLLRKNIIQSTLLTNPYTNENQCHGDCDGDVDKDDEVIFEADLGRNKFNNPCPACDVGDWCVY
jgi:hypothetical protein